MVELPRLPDGVCPVVVLVLGRRGVGKTTLLAALAPDLAPPDKEVIVSPLPTLKSKLPNIEWYKISAMRKEEIEKLFAKWREEGKHLMVLADEGDELAGAGPAGYAGGFVTPSVYDWVNYAREAGGGIALSTRRHSNVARDTTANANLVFIGNTNDPGSLKFYKDWLTDPTDDVDYIQIVRVLPERVFVVWQPQTTPKFGGYVTVEAGRIRPWDPSELRTPAEATTETDGSSKNEAPSPGSSASSAAGVSPISPAPSTAPVTTSKASRKTTG
jgi:energy-coupling factor transporter ATP-binding protein EcfA2